MGQKRDKELVEYDSTKTSSRPLRWLAVLLLVCSFGFIASSVVDILAPCARLISETINQFGQITFLAAHAAFAIVGFLIIFYRPQNRIGWLCLVIGFTGAAGEAVTNKLTCFAGVDPLPARFVFMAWLNYAVLTFVGLAAMFMLLP